MIDDDVSRKDYSLNLCFSKGTCSFLSRDRTMIRRAGRCDGDEDLGGRRPASRKSHPLIFRNCAVL